MTEFHIKGFGKDSGRKRERNYSARDQQGAIALAASDGTVTESITELPPEPATENQISYAKDLGIAIPVNVTKSEISDLLDYKLENDRDPSEEQLQYAAKLGIEHTRFVGKKKIFNLISAYLREAGRERLLLAWFAYRVARSLLKGEKHPLVAPESPLVLATADRLLTEAAILKSVRGYSGESIIWFGEWTSPDGLLHSGGSKRTVAYQRFSEILVPALKIDLARPDRSPPRPPVETFVPPSGLQKKRKAVALLLCIILGLLGAHRFYVDRKVSGAIMVILSVTLWGGLVTIPWVAVDCVLILLGRFTDHQGNRLT